MSPIPGGQSSEDESNSSPMPPNAMMPPTSPKKRRTIVVATVWIPTSKVARVIKNMDEDKWNEGYDSDGERGPFFDAVENEPDGGVEEEDEQDGVLPPSMLGISTTAQGSAPRKATSRKINPAKVAKKRTRSRGRGLKPPSRGKSHHQSKKSSRLGIRLWHFICGRERKKRENG